MKVKIISSEYESYGYYKDHTYEVVKETTFQGKEQFYLTRNDNQSPCWVLKDDCELAQ